MSAKFVSLKFENIEDHKKLEVSNLLIVASVDRAKGDVIVYHATKEDLEMLYGMVSKNE